MSDYSEKVVDYFMHPRNVGEIKDADGVGEVGNPRCGDVMKVYLDIDEKGVIQDAKFQTFGCAAAIASSSMATEMIKGKTIEEALKLTNQDVAKALDGLPPEKLHCSLLAQECIQAAISNYKEQKLGKKPSFDCSGCCNACQHDDEEEVFISEDSRVAD